MDTNAFASPTGSQVSPSAQTTNPLALQQQVSTYPAAISNMIKAIMQGNNDYQNQQKKLMGNQPTGGQPGQPMSLLPPQDPTNPTGTGTSGPPVGFAPPMSQAALMPPGAGQNAPASPLPNPNAGLNSQAGGQQAPAMPVPDQNGGLGSQNAPVPPVMMDPMSATMMQGSPSGMAGIDPMTAALMQGNIPSATPGF